MDAWWEGYEAGLTGQCPLNPYNMLDMIQRAAWNAGEFIGRQVCCSILAAALD